MDSSRDEYLVVRQRRIDRKRRIVTWISIISFLGSGAIAIVPTLQQAFKDSKSAIPTEKISLQQRAKGFELVLQREPENQVALEGLVNVRLRLNDAKGAVPPLEKLVKLQPERQDYKAVLEQLKVKVGKSGQSQ